MTSSFLIINVEAFDVDEVKFNPLNVGAFKVNLIEVIINELLFHATRVAKIHESV